MPIITRVALANASNNIKKLPNVNGDNMTELDSHLALAPMKQIAARVDLASKHACLKLMSSFTGKLGHWAQQSIEALYSLNHESQIIELVRLKQLCGKILPS